MLDAVIVDARSLKPAPDLRVEALAELRGAFLCRGDHPLTAVRGGVRFEQVLQYPIASTPLSDEVARVLVERYGPLAHPSHCVTLRCGEIPSLVEIVKRSDAVLIAIRAAAPGLAELRMKPALDLAARFGLVTIARRTEAPGLSIVRRLAQQRLRD